MDKIGSNGLKDTTFSNHFKHILAGSLSSSVSRFIGHPFEVLKIRFQLQQKRSFKGVATVAIEEGGPIDGVTIYRSMPQAVKGIYKQEGMKGLWRGHNVSQFQGLFQGVTQFWAFEHIRDLLERTLLASMPRFCNFASGFITGTLIVLTLSPLDMMRTRMMSGAAVPKAPKVSAFRSAQQILAAGGLRTFYSGSLISIIHVGSVIGFKFMFYDLYADIGLRYLRVNEREELPGPVLICAGASAGFCANTVTYPMDLIKRRLQVHAVDVHLYKTRTLCKAIVQCTKLILKSESFFGFYKGFAPCVIKSAVSTAVQFSAYDKIKQLTVIYF